jgi:oxygen-independent coproporphyrinogen III oxidase
VSHLPVNLDLVRKYNVPAPRYTSYPPATRFSEAVKWPQLAGELIANNNEARDLSLYIHIPFCQSLCWYCGCNTVITKDETKAAVYLNYLAREMRQMQSILHPDRPVKQLHLGGGTPTYLSPTQILALGSQIRSMFRLDTAFEGSVEIDPRRLTRQHISALRTIGLNRVSLGVQDFDPVVQEAIHRIQPLEQTEKVLNWVREAGFASVNIDLIYGLPYQTAQSFEKTLDEVIRLSPDRIALFSYAHVPWLKPAQRALEKALPAPEEKLRILKLAVEKLTDGDRYSYIGMDHFAKAGDELATAQREGKLRRNFQGYSTQAAVDIYAFGVSAISQTANAYWQNEKDLRAYYAALNAGKAPVAKGYLLTDDDRLRRQVIMQIMCDLALDLSSISAEYNMSALEYFQPELHALQEMAQDGLIAFTTHGFKVTRAGRLLIRNIAMRFDASQNLAGERQFSRTI